MDTANGGSRIIMDAPPEKEDTRPFVHVTDLLEQAGLNVPHIYEKNLEAGFLLLTDVGNTTLLEALNLDDFSANTHWYHEAIEILIRLQLSAKSNTLPHYDHALLRRELQLFPDWYIKEHKKVHLGDEDLDLLNSVFESIIQRNLASPNVVVHRDFMPRNLMMPHDVNVRSGLAILDYQDAVYGPITYDIASLMRDAFHSWDEEVVLDITIRYWEKAKKVGLIDFEGWSQDFGAFYQAVQWMGLQRHLKVAGIFSRLTLRDGKPKYLADAPRFIAYIRDTCTRYRELTPLLRLLDKLENTTPVEAFSFGRIP
jgi:hypothetical protein